MAVPSRSVCEPWTDEVCGGACNEYTLDQSIVDDALQVASDVLFELSGRQFPGTCPGSIRPMARSRCRSSADPNRLGCGCSGCGSVELRGYPVTAVSEVKVDGEILPSDQYRVDEFRYLVRLRDEQGRRQSWPCCQDTTLPDTEERTFSVTYEFGQSPPPAGVLAAGRLACELALACDPQGSAKCKLPKRVISVVRQGISMTTLDPFDFLQEGKTGVYEADLFLSAYNSGGGHGATIWSPDVGPSGRVTTS